MRSALLLLAISVPRACAALLTNLAAVANRYDCLLLDQFGVIHDGKTAYPGAVAAVSDIQQRGKKICVIENEFGAINIDTGLVAENMKVRGSSM